MFNGWFVLEINWWYVYLAGYVLAYIVLIVDAKHLGWNIFVRTLLWCALYSVLSWFMILIIIAANTQDVFRHKRIQDFLNKKVF